MFRRKSKRRSERENQLHKNSKEELIQKMLEHEKYISDMKTKVDGLNDRNNSLESQLEKSKKENDELKMKTKEMETGHKTLIEKLETEKKDFEERFRSVVDKIESTSLSIHAGDKNIIQIGEGASISISDEVLGNIFAILESNQHYQHKVLQRLARTNTGLYMMRRNVKHSDVTLTKMSQEHVEMAENLEKVLQLIRTPSEINLSDDTTVYQQCIDSIRQWRDPTDVNAATLPIPAQRLHRILVTKYAGKNEEKLTSILSDGSISETETTQIVTLEDNCAKLLFEWCRQRENTATSLHELLDKLDKEIIEDEKVSILEEISEESVVDDNEDHQYSEHVEVTNQHLLTKILQNHKLMIKTKTKLDEICFDLDKVKHDLSRQGVSSTFDDNKSKITIV